MIALFVAALLASLGVVTQPDPTGLYGPARQALSRADADSLRAVEFLPASHVTDGSIDYTAHLQRAIDAAAGKTLVLPPFPIRILPQSQDEQNSGPGLVIRTPLCMQGTRQSVLQADQSGFCVLAVEHTEGVLLEGFSIAGATGGPCSMLTALIRVQDTSDIVLRDLRLADSSGPAVVLESSQGARVERCVIEGAAGAGISLSQCQSAWVEANLVRGMRGLIGKNGKQAGSAIELLGSKDVLCSRNLLEGGAGAGILINSANQSLAPARITLSMNMIRDFANPHNPLSSCGIQLLNGAQEHGTSVVVSANRIENCGVHGLWIDGHDGVVIQDNWIGSSEWSGIALARVHGALVVDNTVWNSNTAALAGQAGILLQEHSSGVMLRGNHCANLAALGSAPAVPAWLDQSPPGHNHVDVAASASPDQITR